MSRFDSLSPHEFEHVVADLLGLAFDTRFETFTPGPDGGIDLRASAPVLHVVQCKHYVRSDIHRLMRAAKDERRKLEAMRPRPERYTFVTSLGLSPGRKDELVAILAPFVQGPEDILGADDLGRLVLDHPEVERRHTKLWLGSAESVQEIIRAVVHAGVRRRTRSLMKDIDDTLARWVETPSFGVARSMLADHHVVIVAGAPGVGKTTLARMLLLDSARDGYAPISVRSDLDVVWNMYDESTQQVFFFDDFLGWAALFDDGKTDVRDLAGFIREVRRSDRTRFVLTTRENVLQHARQTVEELAWTSLEADKYALTLDDYSRGDRAKIFYNHIYHSAQVGAEARRDLLTDEGYLKVIDHDNYNPRLIEQITGLGAYELTAEDEAAYMTFCLNTLDHPDRLWRHMYDQALTADAQRLLLTLPTVAPEAFVEELEPVFLRGEPANSAGRRRFEAALKLLDGTFLNVREHDESDGSSTSVALYIRPVNPGVLDFARQQLIEDPQRLLEAMEFAQDFDRARILFMLWRDEKRPLGDRFFDVACATLSRTLIDHFSAWVGRTDALAFEYLEALAERANLLTTLLQEAPELRSRLTTLEDFEQALASELSWASARGFTTVASLITLLRDAELPHEALAAVFAQQQMALVERSPSWDDYAALAHVRVVLRDLLSDEQWQEVRSRFERDAQEALEVDSALGNSSELRTLEELAWQFDVVLNVSAVMKRRRAFRTAEAASAEDRFEDEPDWYEHEYEYEYDDYGETGTDAEIRELFTSLADHEAEARDDDE